MTTDLEPINLRLAVLKELGARWLVEMFDYFQDNPQVIVNGFMKSGITHALGGEEDEDAHHSDTEDTEDDFNVSDGQRGVKTLSKQSFYEGIIQLCIGCYYSLDWTTRLTFDH